MAKSKYKFLSKENDLRKNWQSVGLIKTTPQEQGEKMGYAKKAISCNDIKSLTPDLLKQFLIKKIGRENISFHSSYQYHYANGFEEFILKGICNTLPFEIHLNTADETLFLEVDRSSFAKERDLSTELNNVTFNHLKTVIDDKVFHYESLLSFDADYPIYILRNNGFDTHLSKKFVTLWVNISDPKLSNSEYLSSKYDAKYNTFIEAWILQNKDVKLSNLKYNPKYIQTVGKVEIFEELCKEASERTTYLPGFKKSGMKSKHCLNLKYEREM